MSERPSMAFDAAGKLAMAYALGGDAPEARRWLERRAAAAQHQGQLAAIVGAAGLIAAALLAVGELDTDRSSAALELLTPGPFNEEFWPQLLYARTLFALGWGDRLAVLDDIGQARTSRPTFAELRRNDGVAAPMLAAAEANLLMSLRRGNQAWAVLNYGAEQHRLLDVARARLELLTGDTGRALEIARQAAEGADLATTLDLTLISAVALHPLGRRDEAVVALTESTTLAGSDRLYAFTGVPRGDLLNLMAQLPASAQLSSETLTRLPDVYPASIALLVLTSQEQLVLDGLADGKSPAELAAEMHLSEGTVTTHRRNLYRKLGVNSRETALTAAAELGLLNWQE